MTTNRVGTRQADDGSFQIARPLDGPNEALFVVAGRRDNELVRLLFTRLCAFDEASGAVREARGRRRTLGHFSRLWEEGGELSYQKRQSRQVIRNLQI
jgi:hypothetical protein